MLGCSLILAETSSPWVQFQPCITETVITMSAAIASQQLRLHLNYSKMSHPDACSTAFAHVGACNLKSFHKTVRFVRDGPE